jgi:uncharacterized protein (DUF427 family)
MRPRPDPVQPGQESVWSYPRPPRAEPEPRRIVIEHRGLVLADTTRAVRVLETSHPPTYYLPPEDVRPGALRRAAGRSVCEWKGGAAYWDILLGDETIPRAAWSYPDPTPPFRPIRDHLAFYAAPFDRCTVGGLAVTAQPGGFYGGWVTPDLAGPFKGVPGSQGW